jgi:hypothetical protein
MQVKIRRGVIEEMLTRDCLTTISREIGSRQIFQRFWARIVVPGHGQRNLVFFIASAPGFFARSPEIRLGRLAARHQSGERRSKYFKKSEKKACQPYQTPVILTAKPNQTIGETND